MEKKGYIRREPVSSDARLKKLTLTEKGIEAHETVMRAMHRAEDIACRDITPAEKAAFMAVCEKLTANAEAGLREEVTQ